MPAVRKASRICFPLFRSLRSGIAKSDQLNPLSASSGLSTLVYRIEKASSWIFRPGNKEYVSRRGNWAISDGVKSLGKGKVILLLVAIVLVGGLTTVYLSTPYSPGPTGPTNSTGSTGPTTGPAESGGHAYYITLYAGIGNNETV